LGLDICYNHLFDDAKLYKKMETAKESGKNLYPDIMGHTLKLFPESVQNTNYFSYLCRQDEDI